MGDGRKLARTGFLLYADQLDTLRRVSRDSGAPISELFSRAIHRSLPLDAPGQVQHPQGPGTQPA